MILLFLFFLYSYAEIRLYNNIAITLDQTWYINIPIYAKKDIINAKYDSTIQASVILSSLNNIYNGSSNVDFFLLHTKTIKNIMGNYDNNQTLRFCCSDYFVEQNICQENKLGQLMLRKETTYQPSLVFKHFIVNIPQYSDSIAFNVEYTVNQTGLYNIGVLLCEHYSGLFSGTLIITNPFGLLPADFYGYLSFYSIMIAVYLGIITAWIILCFKNHQGLMLIHRAISIVLLLCFIENLFWYFEYDHINREGYRNQILLTLGVFTTVFRRTFSRMLVLSLSVGSGVMSPSFFNKPFIVFGYPIIYFFLDFLLEFNLLFKDYSSSLLSILEFSLDVLNAVIFYVIFFHLNRLIKQLRRDNQHYKLRVFQNFSYILIAMMISSYIFIFVLIFLGFKMYMKLFVVPDSIQDKYWSVKWFVDTGWWDCLYTIVLLGVVFLWRPSIHSRNIAISTQLSDEDPDNNNQKDNLFSIDDECKDNLP